jgi:transcriptional regulator with XRE-family HTH domain
MALPETPATGTRPEGTGWESIVASIGPKVRQLRQRLGLSLQQLASRSDVSAAAIHKVERGEMVPTITTLIKLSAALGQPVSHFVGDAPQAPIAVHVPAGGRPAPPPGFDGAELTATALAAPTERLRAGAVRVELAAGARREDVGGRHPGEQLLLVTDGDLAVTIAGEEYLVRPGDTLHHPADRARTWHNPGPGATRIICWYLHD